MRNELQRDLYERSGKVASSDPLVWFLYDLLKEVPPGVVAEAVHRTEESRQHGAVCDFTNGYLANYAIWLAEVLRRPSPAMREPPTERTPELNLKQPKAGG